MKLADLSLMLLTAAIVALGPAGSANANGTSDEIAGLTKKCVKCHKSDGMGDEKNPAIAGIPKDELVTDLKGYRSGERKHKMMNLVTKKLTDEDIEELAEHYAAMSKK